MKKNILNFIFVFTLLGLNAQTTENVSIDTGYALQKWYSLENGEMGSAPKDNWDIAFDVSGFGSSIHINSVTGTKLYLYPDGNISDWATVDITDIASWTPYYNSENSWSIGAFEQGIDESNSFDVGWGIYSVITHTISGDSIYVIELSNGDFKKIKIDNLAGGSYNFTYANIDGSSEVSASIAKADYTGKNFGYYSIQTGSSLDREPVISEEWDLLFTQYTAFIPSAYTVAGVLSNNGIEVAKAEGVDQTTYNDWSGETYSTDINIIGYDWKSFSGAWVLADDWVYFVKAQDGNVWKIVFTDFGGSATGEYIFTKEKLTTSSISENNEIKHTLTVYPNPSEIGNLVNIIYSHPNTMDNSSLKIYDLHGRLIIQDVLNNQDGLNIYQLNTQDLNQGIYIVSLEFQGQNMQQKLIIK